MRKSSKGSWGFNTKTIDKGVRPQDDFYRYANGAWLKKTSVPPDESRWGSFLTLRYNTEHQLKALVEGLKGRRTHGSDIQLVADAFASAIDVKRRNKLGIEPITPLRRDIYAIETLEDMLKLVSNFHARGLPSLWGAFVDQDSKQSTRYILHLWQGGLSLPDRDYYLLDKPEQERVRKEFLKHIERILKLAKFNPRQIAHTQNVVMRIETALAKASMKKEDIREPEKIYHKMSAGKLTKIAPAIPWQYYFKVTGVKQKECIVAQPQFFKALSKMLTRLPLEDWKTYMEWHVINGAASALSEPFIKANFEFYGKALTGQKKLKAPWRRALGSTTGMVGESLGKLYVKAHFPESSKKKMDALVRDLFAVYEERIKGLDWMGPATKKKAIAKLHTMRRKIGYPTKWKGYKGLEIRANDFFGNLLRSSEFEHKREMKKLHGPLDRSEWFMYPQTVNAYFASNLNEIVFPAAILQWPFFDPNADMAVNYAGIGSVIGHEITHGFDDKGSKFDKDGNLKNWWSAADRRRFEKKANVLVRQANGQEVESGVFINGELTLGENIADLGGLVIAYLAYQKYLATHGRKTIAGLSPEERFFLGFAQIEREVARPEFKKLAALTDPHAEASWRINCPVSNFEPFYRIFALKKGDTLYRDKKDRAEIW